MKFGLMGRWTESREASDKGEGEMWDRPFDGGVFGILGGWDALAASRVYEGHGERSIFEDGAGSVRGRCYYDD